jgi:hypothetical protein
MLWSYAQIVSLVTEYFGMPDWSEFDALFEPSPRLGMPEARALSLIRRFVGALALGDSFGRYGSAIRSLECSPRQQVGGSQVPLRVALPPLGLETGPTLFALARIMGTSVRMIERHYGALRDGAGAGIASRLDALDAERARAVDRGRDGR